MNRSLLQCAAVLGALAVAAGAFGAHALRSRLEPEALAWWQTAVQWHVVHAVALVAIAPLAGRAVRIAGACFVAGILIFSGTLYVLAWTGARWLGAVTPVGGLLLIAGWLALLGAPALRVSRDRPA